ncbi:MAG: hypothetical protein NTY02_09340 [Acidobacteria bacterium]|nr:hypothetical protein [Acidobacteriota bacterium]
MKRTPVITTDAWQAELERVMMRPPSGEANGLSAQELCQATGRGIRWVRGRLGMVRDRLIVGRKTAYGIDGRQTTVPCYRLKCTR